MSTSPQFSKNDTNIIKGLGILMIMFHNYFHIIPPIPGENEFSFSPQSFDRFTYLLFSYPYDFIRYIFSYFGHYGVQLFVFISSYGLYLSYKEKDIRFLAFLKKRILKIYPALVIVALLLLVFITLYYLEFPETKIFYSILLKLTLIFNFIPNEALAVSGPLWFFALIAQLYIIFPLLVSVTKKYGENMMLAIALTFIIITMFLNPVLLRHHLSLYYTFVGQLPVFCLGIYFAARPLIKISDGIILVALLVFAIGNVNEYVWHFSFVAFTIFMLAVFIMLIPFLQRFKKLNAFLVFTGSFSLFLFAVHGMARFPFTEIAKKYADPVITSLISIVFIAGSYLFAWFVRIIEARVQKFIGSHSI